MHTMIYQIRLKLQDNSTVPLLSPRTEIYFCDPRNLGLWVTRSEDKC